MLIDPTLVMPWLALLTSATAGLLLTWAVAMAPWRALLADSTRVHAVGGSLVLLVVLQMMSFSVTQGLVLHLLGVTTVTLLLGLRITLILGAFALCVALVLAGQSLASAALGWWLSIAVPALVTRGWASLLRARGARHPFVFIMGAGFAGGALAACATALLGLLVLALVGQHEWVAAAIGNWPVIVLIAFPEAFINGTLVTAFVVLAPDLLKHFDSEFYLFEK